MFNIGDVIVSSQVVIVYPFDAKPVVWYAEAGEHFIVSKGEDVINHFNLIEVFHMDGRKMHIPTPQLKFFKKLADV